MPNIRFTVPGTPVAQPRARAVSMGGKARMYGAAKSHAVHEFKAAVRMAFAQAHEGGTLEEPLTLQAVFVLPRPARLNKRKYSGRREAHDHKPDADNLMKSLLDALTGAGAWRDDAQVASVIIQKWYAAAGELPHTAVMIYGVT